MIKHFREHINRDIFSFCLRVGIESSIFALLMIILLNMLGVGLLDDSPNALTTWVLTSALLIAPIIETIICQMIPVAIVRKFHGKKWLQVLLATAVFAILHFHIVGFTSGMSAGLIGGFYFSFTYVRWRERSLRAAYWSTVFVHFIYNTVVIGIAYCAG